MDSLGNIARVEGFKVNAEINGKTVSLLKSGNSFVALVQDQAPVDAAMLLGDDPREKAILQTLREWAPAELLGLAAESQVPASIDGARISITRRVDNPGNPFVSFEFVKV